MSGNKNPLAVVNEQYGGKDKLVEKLSGLIERGEEETDAVIKRLRTASNAKLLHLLQVAESVKKEFGSTEKLAAHVGELVGRAKDADYVKKLGALSSAKLLDMARSLGKRAKVAAARTKAAKPAVKAKATKPAARKSTAKSKPAKS
jgi:hypothetical protein